MMAPSNPNSLSGRLTTVLLLAAILPLIDSSLVNVLLPAIGADLDGTASHIQLGISGYMLAATVGIVVSTTTLRKFGARRVFIASVLMFAATSALVGCSWTLGVFIAARVLQGAACGFIMPAVQQIAVDVVGKDGMREALATIGLPAVIAPAFGPLLGGALADAIGWRALFLLNVPVGLAALALAKGLLPTADITGHQLGIGQAVPATLGMVGLLWGITIAGRGNATVTLLLLTAAVVCLTCFCVLDVRATTPLLDVTLYGRLAFTTVMVLCLIVGAVFYGTLLSTSLHVQADFGRPAWIAGVMLGIQGVGAWAARSLIKGPGKSVDAFAVIGAGLVLATVGTMGVQLMSQWAGITIAVIAVSSLVRGLGLGACTLLALSAAYEVVDEDRAPAVGAHTRLMLQLGGALGTAAVGVWGGSAPQLGITVAATAGAGAVAAWALPLVRRARGA